MSKFEIISKKIKQLIKKNERKTIMKKIFLLLFFALSISMHSQEKSKESSNAIKTDQNQSNDFDLVVKSLQNSKEFLDYLSRNNKKIVIKSINNKNFVSDFNKTIIKNQEILSYNKIDNKKMSDYMILDCVIYYSTYQIEVTISNPTSNKKQSLTIKLEN